ncbi:MAG: hypothetical protein M3Y65_24980 [Pseudomonadota bacterium]|nr:hypothetical protein [Pseudomonadota bacterium]
MNVPPVRTGLRIGRAALATVAAFVKSRPGLIPESFASASAYSAERRRVAKQKSRALAALASCDAHMSGLDTAGWLTAAALAPLVHAANEAGGGRFAVRDTAAGFGAEYICGSDYPTEYRPAACQWALCFAEQLEQAARAFAPAPAEPEQAGHFGVWTYHAAGPQIARFSTMEAASGHAVENRTRLLAIEQF